MPRGTKQHASAATRADVVVPAKKQGTSKSVAQTRPLSSAAKSRTTPRLKPLDPSAVFESKRAKMPVAIEPELATLVAEAPSGQEWLHEIKFDGYRLLCHVADGKARLFTRRQLDWTARFPTIAGAAAKLPVGSAIFDGEAVVLEYDGTSSFQALQMALSEKSYERMAYYAFDLLYLDGYDLRPAPLTARKELLAKIWSGQKSDARLRYCDHIDGDGPAFLRECCRRGLEGIISKRRDRAYQAGRGTDWLKAKCQQREEFVIGGFTDPAGARGGFGALLIGYFDRSGRLLYAGRVGTGFSAQQLLELRRKFDRLRGDRPTFANLTDREAGRGVHWIKPRLVCQVQFTNWTRDHVLRHPSFQGLREDLPATSVKRDAPVPGGLAEAQPLGSARPSSSGRRRTAKKSATTRRPRKR